MRIARIVHLEPSGARRARVLEVHRDDALEFVRPHECEELASSADTGARKRSPISRKNGVQSLAALCIEPKRIEGHIGGYPRGREAPRIVVSRFRRPRSPRRREWSRWTSSTAATQSGSDRVLRSLAAADMGKALWLTREAARGGARQTAARPDLEIPHGDFAIGFVRRSASETILPGDNDKPRLR